MTEWGFSGYTSAVSCSPPIVVDDERHRRTGPSLQENFPLSLTKAIGRKSKNTLTSLPRS